LIFMDFSGKTAAVAAPEPAFLHLLFIVRIMAPSWRECWALPAPHLPSTRAKTNTIALKKTACKPEIFVSHTFYSVSHTNLSDTRYHLMA